MNHKTHNRSLVDGASLNGRLSLTIDFKSKSMLGIPLVTPLSATSHPCRHGTGRDGRNADYAVKTSIRELGVGLWQLTHGD